MNGERVKFNHNWNNLKKRAGKVPNLQEQCRVNKELLNYIRILQEEIDELKQQMEDDGR